MQLVETYLEEKAAHVDASLRARFETWSHAPDRLLEAMRYSLFAGGKRLRPALALAACETVSAGDTAALPAACALEMVHTYSLIHDDLPAMDDDDLRRGQPTLHRKYDEATAILAGDTLLTMAFGVLAETGSAVAVRELAEASGIDGMSGGQFMDLAAESNPPTTVDGLREIHRRKTGALIRCAVRLGAILGEADTGDLVKLTDYGEHLGLAFQIADDILDVTGDEAAMGKRVHKDDARGKATYPGIAGLDEARRLAADARDAALAALDGFDALANPLRDLTAYVVDRTR